MHDWKSALAAPFYIPGRTDAYQPFTYAHPEDDGPSYTVCGNTIAVLRVAGEHGPRFAYYDKKQVTPHKGVRVPSGEMIDAVFDKPRERVGTTTVADLRAALGPLLPEPASTLEDCPECEGEGEVTCYACDREHECEKCDGTGQIGDDGKKDVPEAYLKICDRLFCVHHLAALLARVPDGSVTVESAPCVHKGTLLLLAGDGWEVLCMSLVHPLESGTSAGNDIRPFALTEPAASVA